MRALDGAQWFRRSRSAPPLGVACAPFTRYVVVAPRGRRTVNTEPAPGLLSTAIVPPCASTIARVM